MADITFTKIDIAKARLNLAWANDIPEQQTIVNRRRMELQRSLKDKWPGPHSKLGGILKDLITKRKYYEAKILVNDTEYSGAELKVKLVEVIAEIKSLAIVPSREEIEKRNEALQKEEEKLQKMKKLETYM